MREGYGGCERSEQSLRPERSEARKSPTRAAAKLWKRDTPKPKKIINKSVEKTKNVPKIGTFYVLNF